MPKEQEIAVLREALVRVSLSLCDWMREFGDSTDPDGEREHNDMTPQRILWSVCTTVVGDDVAGMPVLNECLDEARKQLREIQEVRHDE